MSMPKVEPMAALFKRLHIKGTKPSLSYFSTEGPMSMPKAESMAMRLKRLDLGVTRPSSSCCSFMGPT